MASKRPFSATDLFFFSRDLSLSQETLALAPVLLARLCGEHKYTLVKQKSHAACAAI